MTIANVDATSHKAPAPPSPLPPPASPPLTPAPAVQTDAVDLSGETCSTLAPVAQLKALALKYNVPWHDDVLPYKQQSKIIRAVAAAEAQRQGVPPKVALAISGLESGWKMWTSVSHGRLVKLYNEGNKSTDYGVMQINTRAHPDAFPCAKKDLEFNIRYGVAYLAELHDQFGNGDLKHGFGKWDLAMAAYNQGCVPRGPKRKAIAAHYLDLCRAILKHASKP